MPELPEVETTRRGIASHIVGKTLVKAVVRNPRLRWPVADLDKLLSGQVLQDVARRGKYLLFSFDRGVLLGHLGMSGSMQILQALGPPATHDHIDLIFEDNTVLRYTDPRRFGAMLWTEDDVGSHPLLAHLGPEPLEEDFTADYLYRRSRSRTQSIKTFIMDSKVVVGVGNIYANEALFRAGIKPIKAAGKVSRVAYEHLVADIKHVLADAIRQGGTTLRDFSGGDGKPGYFKQQLQVYGRGDLPCTVCGKPLKEIKLGQRTTVYCTSCQR